MEDITVEEVKTRMDNKETLIVIDVREPWEFEEFNIGGRLIPLGTLPETIPDLEDLKNQEVIVHCKAGARSATAKAFLTQAGFTNVRNMIGGIMDWQLKFKS